MTPTQKKVMALAKRMHELGVTEWDLAMRGIPLTAAEALVRKGFLFKTSEQHPIYKARIK